jgi:probable F420-dependent oxidoreductase
VTAVEVSVQASVRDRNSWLALAQRVEAGRFRSLYVADHPGWGPSPWVELAAAAAVTERLRLGTYVVQAGVREPVHIAADALSLGLLAPGRVTLGIGAGHTPAEWGQIGADRPSPGDRARRMIEILDVVADLLAGQKVSFEGRYVQVREASLERLGAGAGGGGVELLVGGGNRRILQAAGRRADIVALSGLGRTLPDGHGHDVRWSRGELERQLELVRSAAAETGNRPVLDALVQVVQVTDDRDAALASLADEIEAPPEDLAITPFVLVGTVEEMAAQLQRQAAEFGITSYVVREPAIDTLQSVMTLLAR